MIRHGDDEYEVIAQNDHNRFEINSKQLVVHHIDGRKEVQKVVGD